jgi:isopenicillin N synthase-like dioxygenase
MTQSLAPTLPPILADARDEIPILDLAAYLRGEPGERRRIAGELRHIFERVGFYFITNHGVPQTLVERMFEEVKRFHAQPLEAKLRVKINQHNVGYMPMRGATTRHSQISQNNKPNVNEAFFAKRDLPVDHPDVVAGKPFRCANQWPENLAGFRETVVAYQSALESLGKALLPAYALALDLPEDAFDEGFREPTYTLRMTHYPQQEAEVEGEYGLAPHTDTSFMTLLAQNRIPGLAIRLPSGRWIDAPAIDGAFLVNGGDLLRRWTNDRFLATPHRVVNRSGQERYAIPFFFDCATDYVMTPLDTCVSPQNPARYDPITYVEYITWYRNQNFAHAQAPGAVY